MANLILSYSGIDYSFPDFRATMDDIIAPGQDCCTKSCVAWQSTEKAQERLESSELNKLLNYDVYVRNIYRSNSNAFSEWTQIKDSIQGFALRSAQNTAQDNYIDIAETTVEILDFLASIKERLVRNLSYINHYSTTSGGRSERICMSKEYWINHISEYTNMINEVDIEIGFLKSNLDIVGCVQDGSCGDSTTYGGNVDSYNDLKDELEDAEKSVASYDTLKKVGLAIVVLVVLFFTFKIIKKRRG